MRYANGKQQLRIGLSAAAAAALIVGPAFAFGGFGGFGPGFGGFHGGFHGGARGGVGSVPARPAIDTPTPRPPFTNPPPAMHIHDGDHDHFHDGDHFAHAHFHNNLNNGFGGWGWGGWGGYGVYTDYGSGQAQPVYAVERTAAAAAPPPCPVLMTWSPKLRRATSQRLCDTD